MQRCIHGFKIMNKAQLFSHLRSALKLGGVWLVTHNYLGSVAASWAVGLGVSALGFLWSHLLHAPVPADDEQGSLFSGTKCLALTAAGVLALCAGCTTAIEHGNVIAVSHKFFGLDIETSSQAANALPTIRLGAGSSRVMFIPTSTNGPVQAPRVMDAYTAKTGLNPFANDIEDNFGSGDVYLGGNSSDASSAILPTFTPLNLGGGGGTNAAPKSPPP